MVSFFPILRLNCNLYQVPNDVLVNSILESPKCDTECDQERRNHIFFKIRVWILSRGGVNPESKLLGMNFASIEINL